jgi:hypothetical protein
MGLGMVALAAAVTKREGVYVVTRNVSSGEYKSGVRLEKDWGVLPKIGVHKTYPSQRWPSRIDWVVPIYIKDKASREGTGSIPAAIEWAEANTEVFEHRRE